MARRHEHPKARLDAKDLRGECEACDSNNWAVTDDTYVLAGLDEGNRLTMSGLPVHAMVCQECGFVRLFAKPVI
jgi:hypothetical protein